tara:strand:- start:211 stop:669 length:459 start_codon:yes stop_codon:yes gene_type:complete
MTKSAIKGMHVPRSLFLGFEHLFDDLERIHGAGRSGTDNYPPHNIVKTGTETFSIELAVAGFSMSELDVTVSDGILAVKGDPLDSIGREYIHKGISSRKFEKSFRISEFVVIDGADLKDGMLVVNARVEVPEERRSRKIEIGSTGTSVRPYA